MPESVDCVLRFCQRPGIYRIIAAKKAEAFMLGFDHDRIVMISKTTLQDSNSNLKESDLTQSLIKKYGNSGFLFAFTEGDAKFNALIWGEKLKEEAGNPFFCVIFQVQTRRYLSTMNVSEAFYSSRDNVWKIAFALQPECPEANYSSGGPGGAGYHQPNAGKVRVVHWLAANGQVTSVQESLFDHTMNGTAPVVRGAAANAPLPSSDVYSRIIGLASNFPLF